MGPITPAFDRFPPFLDVEASSFAADSYPIEIAWSDQRGAIQRFLIRPLPTWQDWSDESEAVHGIDRGRLRRNGWPADYVAERLVRDLGGRVVYSDAPDFDGEWVERLFASLDQPCPIRFEHLDELLMQALRKPGEMAYQVVLRIDQLKREVTDLMVGRHSAGYDVGYLMQLWRRSQGLPVKMNHGAGPLPQHTETGTFTRVKRPPGSTGAGSPFTT